MLCSSRGVHHGQTACLFVPQDVHPSSQYSGGKKSHTVLSLTQQLTITLDIFPLLKPRGNLPISQQTAEELSKLLLDC